jgi:cytochrome c-type biogenesis protein CcmH
MKRFRQLAPFLLLCALSLASVAYAQDPVQEVTDDDVNRVARDLYCPICENTPLDVCETQACEDWRQLIREKLAAGQSEEQIVEYFADIYGERARAMPTTRGFSLNVYIAVGVAIVVAAIYFILVLRRWLARGAEQESIQVPAPTIPLGDLEGDEPEADEYILRLEQELRDSS